MLSLFPNALAYWGFAPFLLRIVLALVFLHWALASYKKKTTNDTIFAIFYAVVGLLFFIGLFTQLSALLAIVYLVVRIGQKISGKMFLTDGVNYYLILLVLCISVFLLGAGHFAFDVGL